MTALFIRTRVYLFTYHRTTLPKIFKSSACFLIFSVHVGAALLLSVSDLTLVHHRERHEKTCPSSGRISLQFPSHIVARKVQTRLQRHQQGHGKPSAACCRIQIMILFGFNFICLSLHCMSVFALTFTMPFSTRTRIAAFYLCCVIFCWFFLSPRLLMRETT